jgi:hypothetical protein
MHDGLTLAVVAALFLARFTSMSMAAVTSTSLPILPDDRMTASGPSARAPERVPLHPCR